MRLLLLLSCLLPAVACTSNDPDGFPDYWIRGEGSMQVCVGAGHGVAGAEVEVFSLDTGSSLASFTTDGGGWIYFDNEPLPSAAGYEIVARKGRYEGHSYRSGRGPDPIESVCLDTGTVRIAAADGANDHPGDTLSSIERPYTSLEEGGELGSDLVTVLTYAQALDDQDIVMLGSGLPDAVGANMDEIVANLQDFVLAGGSVYASDMAYEIVQGMDPGAIEMAEYRGDAGEAAVTIFDEDLSAALINVAEPTMAFAADDPERQWAVVQSVRDDVEVLVTANISHLIPETAGGAPVVMVWSPYGQEGGRIVYSSVVNPGDGAVNGETWRMFMELVLRL